MKHFSRRLRKNHRWECFDDNLEYTNSRLHFFDQFLFLFHVSRALYSILTNAETLNTVNRMLYWGVFWKCMIFFFTYGLLKINWLGKSLVVQFSFSDRHQMHFLVHLKIATTTLWAQTGELNRVHWRSLEMHNFEKIYNALSRLTLWRIFRESWE